MKIDVVKYWVLHRFFTFHQSLNSMKLLLKIIYTCCVFTPTTQPLPKHLHHAGIVIRWTKLQPACHLEGHLCFTGFDKMFPRKKDITNNRLTMITLSPFLGWCLNPPNKGTFHLKSVTNAWPREKENVLPWVLLWVCWCYMILLGFPVMFGSQHSQKTHILETNKKWWNMLLLQAAFVEPIQRIIKHQWTMLMSLYINRLQVQHTAIKCFFSPATIPFLEMLRPRVKHPISV